MFYEYTKHAADIYKPLLNFYRKETFSKEMHLFLNVLVNEKKIRDISNCWTSTFLISVIHISVLFQYNEIVVFNPSIMVLLYLMNKQLRL